MKYIHFEIIIIIILLLISSTCCIIKKLPTTNEIQIANCIVTTAKQSFLDTTNLHLIINNQENHQNIIRILYKHFSLSIESEIIPKKFTTKFMIIEDNQQTLRERFNEPSISKYYEYLIITKISTLTELLSLTNFFYEREFYSSVFIFISLENTTIVQFQSRPRNNNEIYHSIECDEKFLNDKNENLIRRFDRFVCPPTECSLTYWNLVSEAPNNLTYKVYENGTVMAYSIGADMLEEFAKIYEIQITRDLNHSIVDTSWNEGVNAILNDTIDVLFGFAMPTSRDVESLMVSTWNRFYFLGLLYVPEYNYRSTGLGSFFIPMEFDVWICFAFVIIFYSFFTLGVRYVYRKKLIREFLKASDLLRIFLKQDVGDTKNGGLRLIMGLMLLYGLLITTAYESMITSSFISKSPPILLNTLTEVCESNRRFGGPTFIHQFIDNSAYVCSRNFYDR
ncbi:uncharacterized protein LOC122512595 [Leptopilina heterotoma]|uniref:uncharacterized protein LOC122512595 n=1 Tax=Leptopilina heterotoma TaxID=63436 RepID=UPI001CA84761|nr:uncharacterized protein LOC122512595 [Leptopilina heterotoma]